MRILPNCVAYRSRNYRNLVISLSFPILCSSITDFSCIIIFNHFLFVRVFVLYRCYIASTVIICLFTASVYVCYMLITRDLIWFDYYAVGRRANHTLCSLCALFSFATMTWLTAIRLLVFKKLSTVRRACDNNSVLLTKTCNVLFRVFAVGRYQSPRSAAAYQQTVDCS